MPLEEKLHAVPHLKALTSALEPLSGHGHDNTFTHYYTLLKTIHFASLTGQVVVYCLGSCITNDLLFQDYLCKQGTILWNQFGICHGP